MNCEKYNENVEVIDFVIAISHDNLTNISTMLSYSCSISV